MTTRTRLALAAALAALRRPVALRRFDDVFFDGEAKEAVAFALLGHEAVHGRPNSLASATGARHASVLGAIWPGDNYRALLERVGASDGIGGVVRRVAVRSHVKGVQR